MSRTLGAGMALALVAWLALGCTDDEVGETNEDGGAVQPMPDAASSDSSLPDPIDRDASRDADSPLDSAVASDAEVIGCVALSIELTSNGGLVAFRNRFVLEPCDTFRAEQIANDGTVLESCTNTVAQDAELTPSAFNQLVLDEDVQNAIADAPVTYGADGRPFDDPMPQIVIGDAVIEVGRPCDDGDDCPIPEGVQQLKDQLIELVTQQQMASPSCLLE
jgi:hypothetical protein